MSWVAVAIGGASLLGGLDASDDAADAQTDASAAGIGEQRRQFDLAREDLAPYRNVGTQALNALGSIYGYSSTPQTNQSANALAGTPRPVQPVQGPGFSGLLAYTRAMPDYQRQLAGWESAQNQPAPSAPMTGPDYSKFFASPDYTFRRDEGTRDIGNSFAARGGAASGNALRALAEFNSGLAAGEFGNYFNRQASLAGIGQTATNTGINVGQNTANNIGNYLGQAGDARASGVLGRNAALQGGLNDFYDIWTNRSRNGAGITPAGRGGSWG